MGDNEYDDAYEYQTDEYYEEYEEDDEPNYYDDGEF